VTLYSIDLEQLQTMKQLFVNMGNQWKQLTLSNGQGYDDYAILSFKEIPDRNEADRYRDCELFTNREELPALDEDEFYIDDLIDCDVVDENHVDLGKVTEVLSPGAHEVLRIQKGASEVLVPLVDEWVSKIDIENKVIQVNSAEEIS